MPSISEPAPATLIEADLTEFTNGRGRPHLRGQFGDAKIAVFLHRERLDPKTGQVHRVWRLIVERRPAQRALRPA